MERNEYIYEVSSGAMRRIEPIIRCRDCKEHEPSGICSYWSIYDADVSTGDDGFCAWAERVD